MTLVSTLTCWKRKEICDWRNGWEELTLGLLEHMSICWYPDEVSMIASIDGLNAQARSIITGVRFLRGRDSHLVSTKKGMDLVTSVRAVVMTCSRQTTAIYRQHVPVALEREILPHSSQSARLVHPPRSLRTGLLPRRSSRADWSLSVFAEARKPKCQPMGRRVSWVALSSKQPRRVTRPRW